MSANPTNILLPTTPALVPHDPDQLPGERAEQERERQQDCPELINFLKRTCEAIKKQREGEWQRILDSQARCVAYYDNRQVGTVRDGVFHDATRKPGDFVVIDNQYKIQVDKLLMEMCRAFSDIQVRAADKNDTKMVEAAKFAQSRVSTNRRKLLKYSFRQSESMSLLLKTITYRYTRYDTDDPYAPKHRKPRTVTKKYGKAMRAVVCKLCGHPMKEVPVEGQADEYRCINCGSNKQKVLETQEREATITEGYDEVNGGCVKSEHVDPTMVRIDLAARNSIADSSYLWYHQRVQRSRLEAAYPNVKIKNAGGQLSNADRYKMDAESVPSNAPESDYNADSDVQGGDQFEECPLDLFWIDKVNYANVKFLRPQRLKDGSVIPAQQALGEHEQFGNGMCIAMNADQVLGFYGEDKNRKWTFCVYGKREHALHGSGTNSLLGPQDTRNDLKSYLMADTYYNTGRREFIRAGAFTGNRLPAHNEVAVVTDVPDDQAIEGWAHSTSEGTSLGAQVIDLYRSEAGSLQEGAGTSSLSVEGGAPDLKNAMGTATGVNAMREQAVGRMGPNLMLVSEMEEEWSYQTLEMELENFTEERYLKMANQSVTAEDTDGSVTFSAEGIKAFRNCVPRRDLEVFTVPGSWMPRNEMERQAKFAAFVQLSVEIMKSGMPVAQAEQLIAQAAEVYGITEIDLGGWTTTEQVAAARIHAFAATVEKFEKNGKREPTEELIKEIMDATPNATIDMEMDNHPIFAEFYKQWWASDEARPETCSKLLRAVIRTQKLLHDDGVVYIAQELAKDKIESDAPLAIAAQETAAAAAAAGGGGKENKEPSVTLPYKEAPEDIKRQIEADAGYEPSTMDQQPEGDGESGKEIVKAQATMAVNEHKAELEKQADVRKAQLDIDKQGAKAQLDEQRAEGDHSRTLEIQAHEQEHQTGIEGAKLAHQTVTTSAKQQHEAAEKAKDRQVSTKKK